MFMATNVIFFHLNRCSRPDEQKTRARRARASPASTSRVLLNGAFTSSGNCILRCRRFWNFFANVCASSYVTCSTGCRTRRVVLFF